jgi:hypothetical protein
VLDLTVDSAGGFPGPDNRDWQRVQQFYLDQQLQDHLGQGQDNNFTIHETMHFTANANGVVTATVDISRSTRVPGR